ncbi:MAG TPA: hypothetical protein PKO41_08980 [Dokdonella sp.]|nr:hypothetical protein [Dokdonella sp.]
MRMTPLRNGSAHPEAFALLFPACGEAEAGRRAERLRVEIESPCLDHPTSTVAPWVTLSIGVAAATVRPWLSLPIACRTPPSARGASV